MATIPTRLLVYASRLTRPEYRQLLDLAAIQPGLVDMALIDQAMRLAVTHRLLLAQEFLLFAEGLQPADGTISDIAARSAVSRAYYAVHHALRALLLFEERGDVDGHRESIETTGALLKRNPAVRAKLGEAEPFREAVLNLMTQRHLADYHPYGTDAPDEAPADFVALASVATVFARRIVGKTEEYITQKEAKEST